MIGAGSSFDYPFFSKAFYIYSQKNPDVTVNYQSIGSGGGIQQFTAKNVDFGATDVPMNAEELARAGQPVLQIPVTLGGAAVAYNLPGVTATFYPSYPPGCSPTSTSGRFSSGTTRRSPA